MSLVGFHRVLIACAILFCLWVGLRWATAFTRSGASLDLVLAIGFGAAAVGLAWYLARLKRFLGREPGR